MEHLSTKYDNKLKTINHYTKYPEMTPWIGRSYPSASVKFLLVGESHYLDKQSKYHLDPEAWYQGVDVSEKENKAGFITRNIISNGLISRWGDRSKTIYRNIEKAFLETNFSEHTGSAVFQNIGYMNYFQRPAERTGKSINVTSLDKSHSKVVFCEVVEIIKPDAVIFTSKLAFDAAIDSSAITFLNEHDIKHCRAPHPGSAWWNRISKTYNDKTGKQHFIQFVNNIIG